MNPTLADFIVPGTDPDVCASYGTLAERARDAVFGFEDEVALVDIETTGWNPGSDRIIEVAAAVMRGPEVIDRFSMLAHPGVPVPLEITKLTGITDEMLVGALAPEAVVGALVEFVGGRDIVAHNAPFDRGFLCGVAGEAAFPGAWLDTLQLSRISVPRLRSHRLRDLADAFGAAPPTHRAADDVEALALVWRALLVGLDDLPAGLTARLAALAPETEWPLRSVLARHAAGSRTSAADLRELRRRRTGFDKAEALRDADDITCICPPAAEVTGEFSAGGVAGRMYEGFEQRDEQLAMASAVLRAFGNGTHAAIEAGTGVGKSVAYLLPAALFAMRNGIGVGVATKTNALMDQLVYHELPRLKSALAEDDELRYVALKGYDHYPCLRKLDRYAGELGALESDAERVGVVAALMAWVAQSSWGDLDAVNVHFPRDVRTACAASQADCTRKRCRFYPNLCYVHGVRRRASSAHIVVTNHALLFRDVVAAGGILPPIRHWVIDEAHSAESEARKQLTVGASHIELSVVLGALHGRRGGLLENIRRQLRGDAATSIIGVIGRMEDHVARCATLADSLFDFVKDLAPLAGESSYDMCELRVSTPVRDTGSWGTVAGVGASLAKRLGEVLAEGTSLVTLLEEYGPDVGDARADLVGLLTRLADQRVGLEAVVDGSDPAFVYSAELDRRRGVDAERLRAARLDIGEALAEDLYPRIHSAVFTSATIATGESFEHFARSVGLDRLDDREWESLRLASSYDFERQMAVYVPTDLPEPRERGYHEALERLLEEVHRAMGGSVLTLFTNRRDMERLYDALEPRLSADGLALIMQSRGTSAKRLRDEFLADETLSLFALKSFWEGFDAKGDTLRCVVVPRLPFGRPTDPLSEERSEREGPSAWRRYALPEAVIELKQAAGRLIRSSTDAGCLVIADTRVTRQRYGAAFVEALPVADVERVPAAEVVSRIRSRFGRP